MQLAAHGGAQPLGLFTGEDHAQAQAVERGDDEADVEVGRRRRRVLEHALAERAQPASPLAVDLARAGRAEQLDLQAVERDGDVALAR